jgi:hypothetical protein
VGTDTPPETPSLDTLISNVLLMDGNTTAPSGVNIGYSVTVTAPRNMGLDLGTAAVVNVDFNGVRNGDGSITQPGPTFVGQSAAGGGTVWSRSVVPG